MSPGVILLIVIVAICTLTFIACAVCAATTDTYEGGLEHWHSCPECGTPVNMPGERCFECAVHA